MCPDLTIAIRIRIQEMPQVPEKGGFALLSHRVMHCKRTALIYML